MSQYEQLLRAYGVPDEEAHRLAWADQLQWLRNRDTERKIAKERNDE